MDEPLHFDKDVRAQLASVDMLHPERTRGGVSGALDQQSERLVIGAMCRVLWICSHRDSFQRVH
jgi:hypothetical protein